MSKKSLPERYPSTLTQYWSALGGMRKIMRSGYLYTALVITMMSYKAWTGDDWWETPISVLPNMLGFSLGGYAILISFGEERFRALLASKKKNERTSLYVDVSVRFVHFILVQGMALLVALTAKGTAGAVKATGASCEEILKAAHISIGMIGYTLFLYAVTLAIAAALSVFKLSKWFEEWVGEAKEADDA